MEDLAAHRLLGGGRQPAQQPGGTGRGPQGRGDQPGGEGSGRGQRLDVADHLLALVRQLLEGDPQRRRGHRVGEPGVRVVGDPLGGEVEQLHVSPLVGGAAGVLLDEEVQHVQPERGEVGDRPVVRPHPLQRDDALHDALEPAVRPAAIVLERGAEDGAHRPEQPQHRLPRLRGRPGPGRGGVRSPGPGRPARAPAVRGGAGHGRPAGRGGQRDAVGVVEARLAEGAVRLPAGQVGHELVERHVVERVVDVGRLAQIGVLAARVAVRGAPADLQVHAVAARQVAHLGQARDVRRRVRLAQPHRPPVAQRKVHPARFTVAKRRRGQRRPS